MKFFALSSIKPIFLLGLLWFGPLLYSNLETSFALHAKARYQSMPQNPSETNVASFSNFSTDLFPSYNSYRNYGSGRKLPQPPKGYPLMDNSSSEENISVANNGTFVLNVTYELYPSKIMVYHGSVIEGTLGALKSNDNNSLIMSSEFYDGVYIIDSDFYFDIGENFSLFLYIQTVSKTNLTLSVYNYSTGLYTSIVEEYNASEFFIIERISTGFAKERLKIKLISNMLFNATIPYVYLLYGDIYIKSHYYIGQNKILFNVTPPYSTYGAKVIFSNISIFSKYLYSVGGVVQWNYSERSCILYPDTDSNITLIFQAYDYWNYNRWVPLKFRFFCWNYTVDVDKIGVYYTIKKMDYYYNSSSKPAFIKTFIIQNLNSYDLYGAYFKIQLNNSWVNMLAVKPNLTDIGFYINDSGNLIKLPSYLESWDGSNAIFLVKVPYIKARSNTTLFFLYGGISLATHNNSEATFFGVIHSLRDLANKSHWALIDGNYQLQYEGDLNDVLLSLYWDSQSSLSYLITNLNITGILKFRFKSTIYEPYIMNNNFNITYLLAYKSRNQYIALSVYNTSNGEKRYIAYIKNYSKIYTVSEGTLDSTSALDHQIYLEVHPEINQLKVFFISNTYNTTVLISDSIGIIRHKYEIGFLVHNIYEYKANIHQWILRQGSPLTMKINYNEKIYNNPQTSIEKIFSQERLKDYKLLVPFHSIVDLNISDVFGNILYNVSYDIGLNSNNLQLDIDVPLSASILDIINAENKEVKLLMADEGDGEYIFLLEPSGSNRIIVARNKSYSLYVFYSKGISENEEYTIINYAIIDTDQPNINIVLSEDSIKQLGSYFEDNVLFYGSMISDVLGGREHNINLFVSDVSRLTKFVAKNLQSVYKEVESIDSIYNKLLSEVENITLFLTILNITPTFEPSVMKVSYIDENHTKICYWSSTKNVSFIENMSISDVISLYTNTTTTFSYYSNLTFIGLGDSYSIEAVIINSTNISFCIRYFGSQQVFLYIGNNRLLIKASLSELELRLRNSILSSLLFSRLEGYYKQSDLLDVLSINVSLIIDAENSLVKVFYDPMSNNSVVYDTSSNTITISARNNPSESYSIMQLNPESSNMIINGVVETIEPYSFHICLIDQMLRAEIKGEITNLSDFSGFISHSLANRKVYIRDKYLSSEMSLGYISVSINGTVVEKSQVSFISLQGKLFLEVIDGRFGIIVLNITSSNETIWLDIDYGALIVINELNISINIIISLKPENSTVVSVICQLNPSDIANILLPVGALFFIKILDSRNSSRVLYNATICFVSAVNRPTQLILLEQSNPYGASGSSNVSNSSNSEGENQGSTATNSTNSSPLNKPSIFTGGIENAQGLQIDKKYLIFIGGLIASLAIIIIMLKRRFIQRKTMTAQKILEKILSESESEENED